MIYEDSGFWPDPGVLFTDEDTLSRNPKDSFERRDVRRAGGLTAYEKNSYCPADGMNGIRPVIHIDLPCRIDRIKEFPYDKDIPYLA